MSNIREDAQAEIDGDLVARIIMDFHTEFRGIYGLDTMASSLCAVGPLQSMIGLAIKNGHLAPASGPELRRQVRDLTRKVRLQRLELSRLKSAVEVKGK